MRKRVLPYLGLWSMAVALLIRMVFWAWSAAYVHAYFEGIYPAVRAVQSLAYGWVPIPGYYLMGILLMAWLIWRLPRKMESLLWKKFGRRSANLAGGLVATFLVLWGYNYLDDGLAHRMGLERSLEAEPIAEAYLQTMDRAMAYRSQLAQLDTITTIEDIDLGVAAEDIAMWVEEVLGPLGYPCQPRAKVVYMRPDGVLKRLSISGIYNPWTGEANVDNANSSLPRIFTTAHELAHAYGVTSEAEANFAAYLACRLSGHPAANYAAEYALWRSLAYEVNRSYPEDIRLALASAIPVGLRKDREAIWAKATNYRGYFPAVSEAMNDAYLKVQGIEAGVEDYNAFVGLVFAWQQAQGIN